MHSFNIYRRYISFLHSSYLQPFKKYTSLTYRMWHVKKYDGEVPKKPILHSLDYYKILCKGPSLCSPSQHQLPYDQNVLTML